MQIKGDTSKISLTCGTAVTIDWSISGFLLADAGTTPESGFSDCGNMNTVSETTILAGSSDTKIQKVTYAQVTNVHATTSVDVTCLLYKDGGSTSARQFKVTLLAGESMTFDGHKWIHNPANYATFTPAVLMLGSDHTSGSTTPDEVTGLSVVGLQPGSYVAMYFLTHQAAATTTGLKLDMNFTGTVSQFNWIWNFPDVSATAATAAQDGSAVAATAQVFACFAGRAKGTAGLATTISADTANADMLTPLMVAFTVTVAGDLELWHGSEVAANTTIKAGSMLLLFKAAA